jgi:hypothetical protein
MPKKSKKIKDIVVVEVKEKVVEEEVKEEVKEVVVEKPSNKNKKVRKVKDPSKPKRAPSEYAKFVKAHYQDVDVQAVPVKSRFKVISGKWKEHKAKNTKAV